MGRSTCVHQEHNETANATVTYLVDVVHVGADVTFLVDMVGYGVDITYLVDVVGVDVMYLVDVVGADVTYLVDVVGADVTYLVDVAGADVTYLIDVVGAGRLALEEGGRDPDVHQRPVARAPAQVNDDVLHASTQQQRNRTAPSQRWSRRYNFSW